VTRSRNPAAVLAAAAVLAVFVFGLWRLFAVRFAAGTVHPAYSTLHAGPTGARAVFEAFGRLGRPETMRNFLPLSRFRDPVGTTLVFAGAGAGVLGEGTEASFELLEALMSDGLQVVVALDGRAVPSSQRSRDPVANPWSGARGASPGGAPGRGGRGEGEVVVAAGERWGFQFELSLPPDRAPPQGAEVVAVAGGPPSPPRWFSVWRWASLGPEWRTLASVDGRPVIVRRPFGRGSLTLLSDTVFLSNEALWRAPAPDFLAWLLGGAPRLVFDETMHGTVSDPGVMHLVRRYRLLGFFAGAGVLLALFVWRAGTSLVPVHPSVAGRPEQPLTGAEGGAGFSNLLRQTVPPAHLLRACFTEWAKNPLVRRRVPEATVAVVRDLVAAAERDRHARPAAVCRAIAGHLAAARKPGAPAVDAPPGTGSTHAR
jgi:hypothetical protein